VITMSVFNKEKSNNPISKLSDDYIDSLEDIDVEIHEEKED